MPDGAPALLWLSCGMFGLGFCPVIVDGSRTKYTHFLNCHTVLGDKFIEYYPALSHSTYTKVRLRLKS